MKHNFKRLLSIILAVVMIVSLLPASLLASADNSICNIIAQTAYAVPGMEAKYLFDADKDTKWCVPGFSPDGGEAYVIWELPAKAILNSYSLTKANNADTYPMRNPADWTLSAWKGEGVPASDTDAGWEIISSKTAAVLDRKTTSFDLAANTVAAKYYLFKVTKTNCTNDIDILNTYLQLSELAPTYTVVDDNTEYWTVNLMGENGENYLTELVDKSNPDYVLPTYEPYAAAEWNVGEAAPKAAGETVTITGDSVFYAVMPTEHTVMYLAENGVQLASYTVRTGETTPTLAVPEKEGYTGAWDADVPAAMPDSDLTFTAVYTAKDYKLTYYRGAEADDSDYKCFLTLADGSIVEFFNNDNTDMPTYEIAAIEYGTKVTLGEAALPGYIFQYWKDADGGIHLAGSNYEMTGDAYLTAVWTVDSELSCLVSFNTEDGIYASFLAYDGQDAEIPAAAPEKDGSIFLGWEYGGSIYSASGVKNFNVIADADRMMVFNAVWEELTYAVTVDDTVNPAETVSGLHYGDEFTLPSAPEKEGSTFVAWMDADNGTYYIENGAFTVARDYSFIAVWAEDSVERVVKFYDENGNLYDIVVAENGDTVTAPVYGQGRDDCTYVWIAEDPINGGTLVFQQGGSIIVHADMILRAVKTEEAQYGITVNVTPVTAPAGVATTGSAVYYAGETACIDISVPEGFLLKNVNAVTAGDAPVLASLTMVDDTTYVYVLTMPADEVTVNVVLEEIPADSTVVKYMSFGELFDFTVSAKGENTYAPDAVPAVAGYEFLYWAGVDALGNPIQVGSGSPFAIAADAADIITLNAVFTQEAYKIHFDSDFGGPEPADIDGLHYGETAYLADEISKDGCIFVGWQNKDTGILYGAGGAYLVSGDAEFIAIWEKAEYIVKFVNNESGTIVDYSAVNGGDRVIAPAAAEASGKTFKYWQNVDDSNDIVLGSAYTGYIYADTTFAAVFETSQYNVTVEASNCTVNPSAFSTTEVGAEISFTVSPAADYAVDTVFITYTDALAPVYRELTADADGKYTFTMPAADVVIHAAAAQSVFSVFTSTDANTTVTAPTKADADTAVYFTVDVSGSDYVIDEFYVLSASGMPIALTCVDGEFAFSMPAEDVTIYATAAKAELTVTFLDYDNTLLGIVPVASGEYVTAPAANREGYTFDHWEILPLSAGASDFDPTTDEVKEDLVVRAVYVGLPFTVEAGLTDNVYVLNAECTISSGSVNSANLLLNLMNAEAGKDVYFTVAANYDYVITGITVVSADGTKTIVEPTLRLKETVDGISYYTVSFTMPAENVKIDVYTAAKMFRVDVEENVPAAGEYTLNGFVSNNLMVAQGEQVTLDIAPIAGYEVIDVTGTFFDGISYVSLVDFSLSADKTQFSFPMVARDVLVEIIYAPIDYTVDIETSNFETYKPKADVNPAAVVESLDTELTSQGRIELIPATERDYTNALSQIYKIPANDVRIVGDRVYFKVVEYTGYDLDTLFVYFDGFEQTCPITKLADGSYCFDMPADDVSIIATFKEETYRVIKDAADELHGDVLIQGLTENRISADYKEEVSVTVTPDDGWQISEISYTLADGSVMDFDAASYINAEVMADCLDTEHGILFHMPASDVELNVTYAKIDYTVSAVYNADRCEVTYTTPHTIGQQVTFSTEAFHGYFIDKVWVVNDTTGERIDCWTASTSEDEIYGAYYKFTMPASSVTIHVNTVKDNYNVKYFDEGGLVDYENIDYLDCATVNDHVAAVFNCKPGWHFIGWCSDDVQVPVTADNASINDADFVVISNTNIYAVYAKDEIDVVFNPSVNGQVEYTAINGDVKDGYSSYTETDTVFGDTVSFTAVPDEGYIIDEVTAVYTDGEGNEVSIACTKAYGADNSCTYTFRIPASYKADARDIQASDIIVTATFTKDTFTLTKDAACEENGEIAINGTVSTQTSFTYLFDDEVSITATPDNGYYVVSVSASGTTKNYEVTGTAPAADTYAGDPLTLSFNMPAEDLTYTVVYAKIDYTINVADTNAANAEYGTVAAPDTAVLDEIVTLTVTEEEGYDLVGLTVTTLDGLTAYDLTDWVRADNVVTTSFTMPANAVIVNAIYEVEAYLVIKAEDSELNGIIESVDATGTVHFENAYSYHYADAVELLVTAEDGWYITDVSVIGTDDAGTLFEISGNTDETLTQTSVTFNMPNEDVMISVSYAKITYSITLVFDAAEGTVVTDPADTANIGDEVAIEITPEYGYHTDEVVVTDENGENLVLSKIDEDNYSFTMPTQDVTVTVTFEKNIYTVVFYDWNGDMLKSEDVEYEQAATAPADPEREGYTFVGWDVAFDCVTEDLTVTAVYEVITSKIDVISTSFVGVPYGTVSTPSTADFGEQVTFTCDPDDGYRVEDVAILGADGEYVNVNFVSINADYTEDYSFIMPDCDVTIIVTFTEHAGSRYDDCRTGDWYYTAIEFVTDRGYFVGISENLFAPRMNMTRSMFVTVLSKIYGIDPAEYTGTAFPDVAEGAYYAPAVQWAAQNGIVSGYSDGTFGPDDCITREQMCLIMYKFCEFIGCDMSVKNTEFLDNYTDLDQISDWARDAVEWALGSGLILGQTLTTVNPQNLATRAEVAQVIKNLCDKFLYR